MKKKKPSPLARQLSALYARRERAIAQGAARELREIHTKGFPECQDKGPNTCPTWAAIHALESLPGDALRVDSKPEKS